MSYSTQRVVSDGSLVLLSVSIGYLERSHIHVFFNNVENALPWSWVGLTNNQIAFSPAVPNGVEVLVARKTDLSKPYHTFTQGAQFTAKSLDEDIQQVLFIAQEATEQALTGDFYQNVNMHNFRMTNVAAAVNPQDAMTLGQATGFIQPYVNAAAASAVLSDASADLAASYASASAASASASAGSALSAAGYVVPPQSGNAGKFLSTNGAATAWQSVVPQIPAGTRMVFAQASAPVGWTQDTSDAATDRMLRVVNTTGGGVGGSHSPILNNLVPSHTHTFTTGTESASHTHVDAGHAHAAAQGTGYNVYGGAAGGGPATGAGFGTNLNDILTSITQANLGAATGPHTHSGNVDPNGSASNWTPRYIDLIICSKD